MRLPEEFKKIPRRVCLHEGARREVNHLVAVARVQQ